MRRRIAEFRREPGRPGEDFTIGNVILQQPFFFTRDAGIPIASDFSLNIVLRRRVQTRIALNRTGRSNRSWIVS